MAKKKKKEELDPSLLAGYLPGAMMTSSMPITQAVNMEWAGLPPPFSFHVPTPGTSFIDNYLMYAIFLPTPFEQLGTLFDPAGIQEPPHRYLENPSLIIFDIHADARAIQSMWKPGPWRVIGWDPSLPPGASQPGLTEGKYISPASQ